MSKKYYRVLQDTFMWQKGAILKYDGCIGSNGGYDAISDLWDACELNGEYYISANIIESKDNAAFFERVYKISKLGKAVYGTKEAAQEAANKLFKAK